MPEAVLVSAVRTPVGRAPKGALSTTRPDDLAAAALTNALERVPELDRAEVEDVILGCAQQEGESGWNMARMTALRAQLPIDVPGMTVNRLMRFGAGGDCAGRHADSRRCAARGDSRWRRNDEHAADGRHQAEA